MGKRTLRIPARTRVALVPTPARTPQAPSRTRRTLASRHSLRTACTRPSLVSRSRSKHSRSRSRSKHSRSRSRTHSTTRTQHSQAKWWRHLQTRDIRKRRSRRTTQRHGATRLPRRPERSGCWSFWSQVGLCVPFMHVHVLCLVVCLTVLCVRLAENPNFRWGTACYVFCCSCCAAYEVASRMQQPCPALDCMAGTQSAAPPKISTPQHTLTVCASGTRAGLPFLCCLALCSRLPTRKAIRKKYNIYTEPDDCSDNLGACPCAYACVIAVCLRLCVCVCVSLSLSLSLSLRVESVRRHATLPALLRVVTGTHSSRKSTNWTMKTA